jgi:hypothetical protein
MVAKFVPKIYFLQFFTVDCASDGWCFIAISVNKCQFQQHNGVSGVQPIFTAKRTKQVATESEVDYITSKPMIEKCALFFSSLIHKNMAFHNFFLLNVLFDSL